MSRSGFAAPPARQASTSLAGKSGGASFSHQRADADQSPAASFSTAAGDLPLTALVRRNAQPIVTATIVTALVALLLFVVPLVVR